jgi:2,6-dihydroxypseudooxynicotine hydrolase
MTAGTGVEADDLVGEAFRLWGPRMVLGGVDFNDFESAGRRIRRWSEWIGVWSEYGAAHRAAGERFERERAFISAGNAYRRAAACYHFAKFVWVDDMDKNGVAAAAAAGLTRRALTLLDPAWRRVEAGSGEFQVAGNLRLPAGGGPFPVVVLIPGLDSTKEEFPSWEETFLRRGIATLALDGPGQGEVFHLGTRIQPQYEKSLEVALEALEDYPWVDLDRVAVAGISLGGHYATRAGACVELVRAVISISGPFKVDIDQARSHTAAALRFYSRAASDEQAREQLAGLDLTGVASRLSKPALFATGKMDRIVPWEQTEQIARQAPQGTFLLYEDGNHGLTNKAAEVRDLTADWLRTQLT